MNKDKDILDDIKKFKRAKAPDGFLSDLHKRIDADKRSLKKEAEKSKFKDLLNIFLQGKYLAPAIGLAVLLVIFFYVFKGGDEADKDKENVVIIPEVKIPIDDAREQADKLLADGKKLTQQGNDMLLNLMNERNNFLTLLPHGGFYADYNAATILPPELSGMVGQINSFGIHFRPSYNMKPEELRAKIDSLLRR